MISTDPEEIATIEALAKEMVGGQLVLSFFGLKLASQLDAQQASPVKSLAKVWVGDRYVALGRNGDIIEAKKSLFPFAVDVDLETYSTWNLVIDQDTSLPIPNPGIAIANYLTRSLSGLRRKDSTKVDKLTRIIEDKAPDLIDWLVDGPGASQMRLACLLHTLREPVKDPQPLEIGETITIKPLPAEDLVRVEELMVGQSSLSKRAAVISASRTKSKVVKTYEKSDKAVTWWQKEVEPRIDSILKNN